MPRCCGVTIHPHTLFQTLSSQRNRLEKNFRRRFWIRLGPIRGARRVFPLSAFSRIQLDGLPMRRYQTFQSHTRSLTHPPLPPAINRGTVCLPSLPAVVLNDFRPCPRRSCFSLKIASRYGCSSSPKFLEATRKSLDVPYKKKCNPTK